MKERVTATQCARCKDILFLQGQNKKLWCQCHTTTILQDNGVVLVGSLSLDSLPQTFPLEVACESFHLTTRLRGVRAKTLCYPSLYRYTVNKDGRIRKYPKKFN